jgi:hypothetical protein
MNCPQCRTENPEGARFCLNCATRLLLVCAKCGTELPPQAEFCLNCAAPAGATSPAAALEERDAATLDKAIQRPIPAVYAERLLATRG